MNYRKSTKVNVKSQRDTNVKRRVTAFLFGLLFLAILMILSGAIEAWGHEPHTDTVGNLNVGRKTPHWHWFPGSADTYAGGMSDCKAQQMLCQAGEAETDRFKRYNPQGKAYWLVYCRACGSHLGSGQFRYGGLIVSPTATPTLTHTAMATVTPTATPTATPETGEPSVTPTATATPTQTKGPGGRLPVVRPPSAVSSTPTATPTLLIIRPESSPVPTAGPSSPVPPLRGVNTPTPQPTPTQRPWRSPCLIQHPGAPLNLCKSGNGWRVYYFGHGGQVRTGPFVPRWGGIEDSIFFATASPTTGKPVLAQWIADRRVVRIITYYDHYPHASHKPYVFDIMPDGTVIHRNW